jgi:type II secretory pathway pseudopilin PulG
MRMRMKPLKGNRELGFTLVEIVIAFGMLGLLSLTAGTLVVTSYQGQMKAETNGDFNRKAMELGLTLAGSRSCQSALSPLITNQNWGALNSSQGLSLNRLSLPTTNGQVKDVVALNQVEGRIKVTGLSLRIQGAIGSSQVNGLPHTSYYATLEMKTENVDEEVLGLAGVKNKVFPLILSVSDDARQLAGCFEEAANSGVLQATCESLGGQYIPSSSNQAARCTALDPLNADIQQEIQSRIAAINEVQTNLNNGISQLNQNLTSTSNQINQLIQSQASQVTNLIDRLAQTNQNLETTNRNLASTNQNLNSTNQNISSLQVELAQTTNQVQSRIDELNRLLDSYRNDLNDKQQVLAQLQENVGQSKVQLDGLAQASRQQQEFLMGQNGRLETMRAKISASQNEILYSDNRITNLLWTVSLNQRILWDMAIRIQNQPSCPYGRNEWGNCNVPNFGCVPSQFFLCQPEGNAGPAE